MKATREKLVREIDFDVVDDPPSLPELLDRDKTRKMMLEFACSLFCDEQIHFYDRVRQWQLCTSDKGAQMRMAQAIVDEFIAIGGEKSLNLGAVERDAAIEAMRNGAPTFDAALQTVTSQVRGKKKGNPFLMLLPVIDVRQPVLAISSTLEISAAS